MHKSPIPQVMKSGLRFARYTFSLGRAFFSDFINYSKYSRTVRRLNTRTKFQAQVTLRYHAIEKGLAMPNPRPNFGETVVRELIKDIAQYESRYGADHTSMVARNSLHSYFRFSEATGTTNVELMQEFEWLCPARAQIEQVLEGGVTQVTRGKIQSDARGNFSELTLSRHSIREFSTDRVESGLITQAVRLAQRSPSVCNRQAARVYVFSEENRKRAILALQSGNRGFGDQAGMVIIVTADLQAFVGVGERNQCWADGGMFAMSMVYALHYLGLGTCCLNWCVPPERTNQLRTVAGIPSSEAIIMLLAVGHLPERFRVTDSPRKPIHEILHFDGETY